MRKYKIYQYISFRIMSADNMNVNDKIAMIINENIIENEIHNNNK